MSPNTRRRPGWSQVAASLAVAVAAAGPVGSDTLPFRDTFRPRPDAGWSWVREDKTAWRVGDGRLEVRIQPGNNWGPPNDAKNVLVRPAPDPSGKGVEIAAAVEN